MSSNTGTAPAQNTGLPPVEDEDIKVTSDQGNESKESSDSKSKSQDSKTAKRDESQPSNEGAKEKGPGPWAQKLADAGLTDPAFDEFLRNEVQPYITQLEQGGVAGPAEDDPFQGDTELRDAAFDLFNGLRTNPEQVYSELGELLQLTSAEEPPAQEDPELGTTSVDEGLSDDEPVEESEEMSYVREMMQREQTERADAEYQQFLDGIAESVPGFDPDMYTSIFLASGGDPDYTWKRYQEFHNKYGLADRVRQEEAPNVMGQDGGTPPPEAPQYDSIASAMDSYLTEDRARRGK